MDLLNCNCNYCASACISRNEVPGDCHALVVMLHGSNRSAYLVKKDNVPVFPFLLSHIHTLSPPPSPQDLEQEVAELQVQIASLRESMEAETLSKVDLQNNIQSLREELAFRKKVYEEVCGVAAP